MAISHKRVESPPLTTITSICWRGNRSPITVRISTEHSFGVALLLDTNVRTGVRGRKESRQIDIVMRECMRNSVVEWPCAGLATWVKPHPAAAAAAILAHGDCRYRCALAWESCSHAAARFCLVDGSQLVCIAAYHR